METKNNILYINFVDLESTTSGSSVRPKKMLDAFKEYGYNVYMLTGSNLRTEKKERIKKIKQIELLLDKYDFDFCYIESPSGYIVFNEDHKLIKKINEKNIPIGYFYRDIYYKFSKKIIFNNKKICVFSKKYLRYLFHKYRNSIDERIISKYVDIVFLPSNEMKKYLNFKNMISLPPAGEIKEINQGRREGLIYVGGLSERYGTNHMLKAVEYLNKNDFIPLTIVCREGEVNFINEKYLNQKWLRIVHGSGSKLDKYYNQSKLALIPIEKCEYNDFAISVKLFEYMSYNIPFVCTNCKAMQDITLKEDIGVVSSFNDYKKFAEDIKKLYNDEDKINKFKNNMSKSLKDKNLWIHRVNTIREKLYKVKK